MRRLKSSSTAISARFPWAALLLAVLGCCDSIQLRVTAVGTDLRLNSGISQPEVRALLELTLDNDDNYDGHGEDGYGGSGSTYDGSEAAKFTDLSITVPNSEEPEADDAILVGQGSDLSKLTETDSGVVGEGSDVGEQLVGMDPLSNNPNAGATGTSNDNSSTDAASEAHEAAVAPGAAASSDDLTQAGHVADVGINTEGFVSAGDAATGIQDNVEQHQQHGEDLTAAATGAGGEPQPGALADGSGSSADSVPTQDGMAGTVASSDTASGQTTTDPMVVSTDDVLFGQGSDLQGDPQAADVAVGHGSEISTTDALESEGEGVDIPEIEGASDGSKTSSSDDIATMSGDGYDTDAEMQSSSSSDGGGGDGGSGSSDADASSSSTEGDGGSTIAAASNVDGDGDNSAVSTSNGDDGSSNSSSSSSSGEDGVGGSSNEVDNSSTSSSTSTVSSDEFGEASADTSSSSEGSGISNELGDATADSSSNSEGVVVSDEFGDVAADSSSGSSSEGGDISDEFGDVAADSSSGGSSSSSDDGHLDESGSSASEQLANLPEREGAGGVTASGIAAGGSSGAAADQMVGWKPWGERVKGAWVRPGANGSRHHRPHGHQSESSDSSEEHDMSEQTSNSGGSGDGADVNAAVASEGQPEVDGEVAALQQSTSEKGLDASVEAAQQLPADQPEVAGSGESYSPGGTGLPPAQMFGFAGAAVVVLCLAGFVVKQYTSTSHAVSHGNQDIKYTSISSGSESGASNSSAGGDAFGAVGGRGQDSGAKGSLGLPRNISSSWMWDDDDTWDDEERQQHRQNRSPGSYGKKGHPGR